MSSVRTLNRSSWISKIGAPGALLAPDACFTLALAERLRLKLGDDACAAAAAASGAGAGRPWNFVGSADSRA